jgi:peptidyl-prolyl cis-trans isomerase D
MLGFMRAFAKTWYAKILFGVLIIAFGAFGVNNMLRPQLKDDVIEAGSRSVSPEEFKTEIDDDKKQLEQEQNQGQPIPMEVLAQQGLLSQMTEDIASQKGFAAWLDQIGLRPSDKVVTDLLKTAQQFFNPVTGAFDRAKYDEFLHSRGVTEKQEEARLKDEIARQHYIAGMRAGFQLPRIYGAVEAMSLLQSRDASWFVIGPKQIAFPDKPSDDQLKQFISQNASKFRQPETRVMTAVMFVPAAVAKSVQIDEAELKKAYDFRKDTLSQPETRSFVVVPAKTQQAAAQIASSLKAGTDPATVAKSNGVQPISFDGKPKSAVPDPAVAAQAFAMQAGEVSAPVKGQLGWAVIKLSGITPGHEVTFEQARPALEADARKRAAAAKVDDLVQKYQDLRDKGVNMADAAKQLGLPMQTFPPFTKEGAGPNGRPYMGPGGQPFTLPKAMLDSLFSLPKGGESSEVDEAGQGVYFALHVDDIRPSFMPTVNDETRGPLTQAWMQQEIIARIKQAGDAAAQRLRKGEDIAAIAKSMNAELVSKSELSAPQSAQEPDAQVRAAVFETAPNDAFSAPTPTGFAVGKVTAVHPPAMVRAAEAAEVVRARMGSRAFEGVGVQAYAAARKKLKVKINQDLVNQVLNITPPGAPKKK